ncbi:MAG TPA: hypothetical protein VF797_14030 [Noviherbaspirillum sp.]
MKLAKEAENLLRCQQPDGRKTDEGYKREGDLLLALGQQFRVLTRMEPKRDSKTTRSAQSF